MNKPFLALLASLFLSYFSPYQGLAQVTRQSIDFNASWDFHFAYDFTKGVKKQRIDVPHTWNVDDVKLGIADYKRTAAIYEKTLNVESSWQNKRVFLYFEGVNSVASIAVNNKFVKEHKGGYTAFCVEITDHVKPGANAIAVTVSNAYRLDVLPLHGDFNVFGGIHRPVSVILTDKDCISPLDYASPGIYISQKEVSDKKATIEILTKLSLTTNKNLKLISHIINEKTGEKISANTVLSVGDTAKTQEFVINNPVLWNGLENPFLYKVEVSIFSDNQLVDHVTQPLGIRYYTVDAEKGFFLNGKYLNLLGVGRHEDVKGKGSALTYQDHKKDMDLMLEMGANSARLTHYPHNKVFYNLADEKGLILWSEIPFVGEGGYMGTGYVNSPALAENAKQNLIELIRQNYNHPSIMFWGLFNELKLNYDDPQPLLKELNILAKKEDPYRLTTMASNLGASDFENTSDLMGWNKYFGWYGNDFEEVKSWADQTHAAIPNRPFALTEYGAGGSPFKHYETLVKVDPNGRFHPEEWQTAFHEKHWEILKDRNFIWGKFIWSLADFSSSIRTEGDTNGINDKGLVTYDRAIKKDAYYFYKANWNKAPMLYLAEKRNNKRKKQLTTVKVFTNIDDITLTVNGKHYPLKKRNNINTIEWKNVSLKKGENKIHVSSKSGDIKLEDSCIWILQ
ncbi:MAG TPA: glycoside hydrolase family 2 TIM barrel-domain containing protein [Pedobacter sp.]|nr:glycoside hydrolase family 2 TIM barrel-domain containing protein [Pedobacter sp.]